MSHELSHWKRPPKHSNFTDVSTPCGEHLVFALQAYFISLFMPQATIVISPVRACSYSDECLLPQQRLIPNPDVIAVIFTSDSHFAASSRIERACRSSDSSRSTCALRSASCCFTSCTAITNHPLVDSQQETSQSSGAHRANSPRTGTCTCAMQYWPYQSGSHTTHLITTIAIVVSVAAAAGCTLNGGAALIAGGQRPQLAALYPLRRVGVHLHEIPEALVVLGPPLGLPTLICPDPKPGKPDRQQGIVTCADLDIVELRRCTFCRFQLDF